MLSKRLDEARQVLIEGLRIDPNWYGFPYGRLGVIHLLTNPAYDSFRQEPRFRELLERLNLAQFVRR